jgi:hypothetical protein
MSRSGSLAATALAIIQHERTICTQVCTSDRELTKAYDAAFNMRGSLSIYAGMFYAGSGRQRPSLRPSAPGQMPGRWGRNCQRPAHLHQRFVGNICKHFGAIVVRLNGKCAMQWSARDQPMRVVFGTSTHYSTVAGDDRCAGNTLIFATALNCDGGSLCRATLLYIYIYMTAQDRQFHDVYCDSYCDSIVLRYSVPYVFRGCRFASQASRYILQFRASNLGFTIEPHLYM